MKRFVLDIFLFPETPKYSFLTFWLPTSRLKSKKLFKVACMAVKVQITRLDIPEDMMHMINRKMLLLQQLFNNVHIREEIGRKRTAVLLYYQSLCNAELTTVRYSILNSLRNVSVSVSVLVDEGLQHASGQVIVRRTGPNARNLGLFRTFNTSGFKEHRFPIAKKEEAYIELNREVVGENL